MDTCMQEKMGPRRSWRMGMAAGLGLLVIALAPAASLADDNTAGDMAKGIGIGSASALSSLIYGPLKIAYATTGVVVVGLGWAVSGGDTQVAKIVMTPAIYGDYVVSPEVLRGNQPLEFYGRAPGYGSSAHVASAPPDDW